MTGRDGANADRTVFPEEGAVLLWRRICGHRFWNDGKPFSPLKAWIWCLMRAAWADHERYWHGRRLHLKRGQFVTSEPELVEAWSRSRHWIRDFFDAAAAPFTDEDGTTHPPEVDIARNRWGTIVTVRGLAATDGPPPRRRTGFRTGAGQGRDRVGTTIEEGKEGKEETTTTQADHEGPLSTGYPQEGVRHIFETFKKATGQFRTPTVPEQQMMREVIQENDGDWRSIVQFVGANTPRLDDAGRPIRSVSYSLTAWRRERDSVSRGVRRPVPSGQPKPAYHEPAKIRRPDAGDEPKHGAEHVAGILKRLGLRKKGKEEP